jgi:hypothetical protein
MNYGQEGTHSSYFITLRRLKFLLAFFHFNNYKKNAEY